MNKNTSFENKSFEWTFLKNAKVDVQFARVDT